MLQQKHQHLILQCVRITLNIALTTTALFYLYSSADVEYFQQIANSPNSNSVSPFFDARTLITNPYTLSATFVGLSVLSGIVLRIVMANIINALDRISSTPSFSVFIPLTWVSVGTLTLWVSLRETALLISALQFFYAESSSHLVIPQKLKLNLLLCVISTMLQSLLISDLLYSLPMLLRLHSMNAADGVLLLIDTGRREVEDASPLAEVSRKLSFTSEFQATISTCVLCHSDSLAGDLLFGHQTINNDDVESTPHKPSAPMMEIIHASCAARHCLLQRDTNNAPSWLPIDHLDGRTSFVWIYIFILSCITRTYLSAFNGLKFVSSFFKKFKSKVSHLNHCDEPLLLQAY